jgi:hypothetical protein
VVKSYHTIIFTEFMTVTVVVETLQILSFTQSYFPDSQTYSYFKTETLSAIEYSAILTKQDYIDTIVVFYDFREPSTDTGGLSFTIVILIIVIAVILFSSIIGIIIYLCFGLRPHKDTSPTMEDELREAFSTPDEPPSPAPTLTTRESSHQRPKPRPPPLNTPTNSLTFGSNMILSEFSQVDEPTSANDITDSWS